MLGRSCDYRWQDPNCGPWSSCVLYRQLDRRVVIVPLPDVVMAEPARGVSHEDVAASRCWADGACIPAGAGASVGVLVTARFPRCFPAGAGAAVVLGRRGLLRGFDASLSNERLVTLVAVLRLALTL